MKDSLTTILEICKKEFGFDFSDKNKERHYIRARAVYYYCAMKILPRISMSEVARKINRDHATILHAKKNFTIYFNEDRNLYQIIDKILERSNIELEMNVSISEEKTNILKRRIGTLIKEVGKRSQEVYDLKQSVRRLSTNPLIKEISELSESEYAIFEERTRVILKSIKSYRTYDNTDRKEFNVKV